MLNCYLITSGRWDVGQRAGEGGSVGTLSGGHPGCPFSSISARAFQTADHKPLGDWEISLADFHQHVVNVGVG